MTPSKFVEDLANYFNTNLPDAEIYPFPRKLVPGSLIRGYVALTEFAMPEVNSIGGPQALQGVVTMNVPASDNDLYSEEWSYFEIIDRLGFEHDKALFKLFRNDRTLGGICQAFVTETFTILPYEDEDDDYSEGSFWSIVIPFRAYI